MSTQPEPAPEILDVDDVNLPEVTVDELPDDPLDGADCLEGPTDEKTGQDPDL